MTDEVLAVQVNVAECASTPNPVTLMESGEFEALLRIVTLPMTLPVAAGAKVTFSVTICPGVMICPLETPEAVKPAPEIVTLETVILTVPEFLSVTPRELLLVTITLSKLRVVELGVSAPGVAAFTVSVAALLVALPADQAAVERHILSVGRTAREGAAA